MPAWWSKKGGSKNKEDKLLQQQDSPGGKNDRKSGSKDSPKANSNNKKSPVEEVQAAAPVPAPAPALTRNSPRVSRDFVGEPSGFLGFEWDSTEKKKGHPLPRPCGSSGTGGDHNNNSNNNNNNNNNNNRGGVGAGYGSGSLSGSESSVSSYGSSTADDPIGLGVYFHLHQQHHHHGSQLGVNRSFVDPRGQGDIKFNTGSRSPGPGSRSPRPGSRSPVPGSRGTSRPTSPLHPRFSGINLDSPTGRVDDGKNQCHPLPLPPGSPSSPSSLPSPTSPATLSKWKKGKLIGRGTFGHVYVGFNSESGQMCAIKEVSFASDEHSAKECLKQLNQEINLLSQLSHPNIVRYYGSELSDKSLSVYLEYVSGGSIHKLLQEYGAFKEPVIQNYTRQILSGLAYLHGRSTVHRDIKGANILVGPNGDIKLADFGMAKHITSCSSMLSFKGSPYWMAPEVVMNTNGYNLAVDIWSLGCTILEMATSKPPWSQYEGVAAIFKIGNSKDMPNIPDYLSNDARSFIKLCLQRDPLSRPSASDLLNHPFIRDQATSRAANISITRDAFPYTFDGSRTPPMLELNSGRRSFTTGDTDHLMQPGIINRRAVTGPRDDIRTITSLPVSPSSSPLRQHSPAHRSCFLSPPHPAFPLPGQAGNNLSDYSLYSTRSSTNYLDISILKGQVPGASPSRPI